MLCTYCLNQAEWVENKEIYGKNYGKSFMVWLCKPCDAYVGCHNNTKTPLGTLANRKTRDWRKKAHAIFDPIWKNKHIKRDRAYGFLRRRLGHEIHIGESDVNTCKIIIELCKTDEWFLTTNKERV